MTNKQEPADAGAVAGVRPEPRLLGKMSIQEKVAELESRIAALEKRAATVTTTKTTIRTTTDQIDIEPELSSVWKAVDAVFEKLRKVMK